MPVSNFKEWNPFRETYLYTVDINDVLDTNLDLIQKTLESLGIEFIGSPEDRPGVRLNTAKK